MLNLYAVVVDTGFTNVDVVNVRARNQDEAFDQALIVLDIPYLSVETANVTLIREGAHVSH
ncbi:MAG TPA: hypothetical protein VKT80_05105 [Chloroflexota bacterium]|nr:hypothetical protein [Chloroflexota bacterium]